MGETAKFEVGGKSIDLPVLKGTEGPAVIGSLRLQFFQ